MKTFLTLIFLTIVTSCVDKDKVPMPVSEVDEMKIQPSNSIETKITNLEHQIEKIDEKKVMSSLGEKKSITFATQLRNLRESFNETVSLIKEKYTPEEKRELETQYIKTKEIWDYIVKNYPI